MRPAFPSRAPRRALRHVVACAAIILAMGDSVAVAQSMASPPRRDVVRADDGHPLTVWSRRPPRAAQGSVLLLHGRTWSALPNFDLHVHGQRVSLMEAFVARGYAVYALDQRGYGATPRDSSQWLTPSRAARDASVVLDWIASRERHGERPALVGYSQGSLTAMLAAQRDTAATSALVLYGFPLDVAGSSSAAASAGSTAAPWLERRATTLSGAEEDFITPESTPPGVKEAYGRAAVAADPVRTDWRDEREFLSLDPAALRVPVLLINGERDPYAGRAQLGSFLSRVANVDRSWVVLAHADHAAHLERQRDFVDAITRFLDRERDARYRPGSGSATQPVGARR